MKKSAIIASMALGLAFTGGAQAATWQNSHNTQTHWRKSHQLHTVNPLISLHRQASAGFSATYQHYAEHNASQTLDEEHGWMPTYHSGISWMFEQSFMPGHLYFEVNSSYGWGMTTYSGSTQSGTPVTTTTHNQIVNISGKMGDGFLVNSKLMVLPYLAYGHRYWDRGLGGPTPYHEYYDSNYIGAGVATDYRLTRKLTLTGDVMAASTFANSMDMHIPTTQTVHFALGDKALVRLSLKADYSVSRHWGVYGGVRYTRFQFGHSGSQPVYHNGSQVGMMSEPDSTTNDVSLISGVRYKF